MGSYYGSMALIASRSGVPGQSIPVLTVPYAQVVVTNAAGTDVNLFGDAALTVPIPNSPSTPVVADSYGNFGFYLAPGNYLATITNPFNGSSNSYPFSVGGSGGGGNVTPFGETPTGAINGSNTTFTLNVIPNLLFLTLNGNLLTPGLGYTLASETITMASAPQSGDTLYARGF